MRLSLVQRRGLPLLASGLMAAAAGRASAQTPLPAMPPSNAPSMASAAADALRVRRDGDRVQIRSAFSAERDLVVSVGKGSNGQINFQQAWLVPRDTPFETAAPAAGILIHGCGDDATPWNINGTYIGGNHGCSDARELASPGHGLTDADLGSEWTDAAGTLFYLIRVASPARLWVLSQNKGADDLWKFTTTVEGRCLAGRTRAISIGFTNVAMTQWTPAIRIARQDYLADGRTPLANATGTTCRAFEIVEEYDILNPAGVLERLIRQRGRAPDLGDPTLPAVIRNRIVYRFFPGGATVVDHRATALQAFHLGYMGFIQSAKLATGKFDAHDYFIPKTRPFTLDGTAYDFTVPRDYRAKPPVPLRFGPAQSNLADSADLPDRFIQLLGRRDGAAVRYEVGYALGYALTEGLTRPAERAAKASSAGSLNTTGKSYPVAIDAKMGNPIPAGTTFHGIAYRQYFDPAAHPLATAVYAHPQGSNLAIYAHAVRPLASDRIALPADLVGQPVRLVERSGSAALLSGDAVGTNGIAWEAPGPAGGWLVLQVPLAR